MPLFKVMEQKANSFRNRLFLWLARTVLPLSIRILGFTWRLRIHNWENFLPQNVIFSIWHGHIIVHSFAFRNRGVKVLVSRSFDGEIITRAIEKLGFGAIRGSSSKGGTQALLEIIGDVKSGSKIAITPDGPKGPGYVVKDGIATAAIKSGFPVVPVVAHAKFAIKLKSWDAMMIPLPFAKVEIFIGKPISFDADCTIDKATQMIQEAMMSI